MRNPFLRRPIKSRVPVPKASESNEPRPFGAVPFMAIIAMELEVAV